MAGPIYKAFMFRFKEPWYQLTEEERGALAGKGGPERVGGKTVVICRSAWSNEQWIGFGIEEYPTPEDFAKFDIALFTWSL